MYPCDKCGLQFICTQARTQHAAEHCEPVRGVAVIDVAPDALDAAFWQMVAEDMAAAEDHAEEQDRRFAALRGVL